MKGGHLPLTFPAHDYYAAADENPAWIQYPRIASKNTHGTGCTYSAAIAAFAARGEEWRSAVEKARQYLQGAITAASTMNVGNGFGPVCHYWNSQPVS
jgi:hydroxymethylpyrimidine/phosphomethylpyrimidine kinase